MLLGCCIEEQYKQQRKAAIGSKQTTEKTGHYLFSSKQTTAEETSPKDDSVNKPNSKAELRKWSSFTFPLTITGESTSAGSGLRLIPVVLPAGVAEHILCKINPASLSANSLSSNSSFHLSIPIAIITGDYRLFSFTAKTTLVSLLGCLLYTSPSPRDS